MVSWKTWPLVLFGKIHLGGAWSYEVRVDQQGVGIVSPAVTGNDGMLYFTTKSCVYDLSKGSCVNATGELIQLDPSTGSELWGSRFDGAGVATGARPMVPIMRGNSSAGTLQAIVTGAETLKPLDDTMHFFVAGFPLSADHVTCEVPSASGNRKVHSMAAASKEECTAAGGCWDDTAKDTCALVDTAQTEACSTHNPTDEAACVAEGCCFNAKYSPGWCFRGSPRCFKPAPSSSWSTPRPGPEWISSPAISDDGKTVAFVDCREWAGKRPNDCGIGAYGPSGARWRFPLAAFCNESDSRSLCMCPAGVVKVPSPALGPDAVYAVVCASHGLMLVSLDLSQGHLLWARELLSTPALIELFRIPPEPVYSKEHDLLYIGEIIAGDTGTVSARSPRSGDEVWSHAVKGYSCTTLSWRDRPAVGLHGDAAIFWDDFALRAVEAKTGKPLWDTANSTFAVLMTWTTPSVNSDIVVSVKDAPKECRSMNLESYSLMGISAKDGSMLGIVKSPSSEQPWMITPPVVAGDHWVFTETRRNRVLAPSTVYGVKSPAKVELVSI